MHIITLSAAAANLFAIYSRSACKIVIHAQKNSFLLISFLNHCLKHMRTTSSVIYYFAVNTIYIVYHIQ